MKINYNAAAMRASTALNISDAKVSKSLGRLSSGLKVTTSKDNPSGYAIGRKMNTQIVGLGRATQSSQNGISVIETADGALTEVHEMLQRMNELAVKGETGTLTTSDRMTLEAELKQLKAEVTRISTDTEFNGQTLLDGTFDLRGYSSDHRVKVGYYSDEVTPKQYEITQLNASFDADGNIVGDVDYALRGDGDRAFPDGVTISQVRENKITFKGPSNFEMTLEVEPPALLPGTVNLAVAESRYTENLTFDVKYKYVDGNGVWRPVLNEDDTKAAFIAARDKAKADGTLSIPPDAEITNIDARDVYNGDGDVITISNNSGFSKEIRLSWRPGSSAPYPGAEPPQGTTRAVFDTVTHVLSQASPLILDITGIGAMDTQTGANEGQQLAIRIPTMSLNRMGLENTNVTTIEDSAEANESIKSALLYVSDARSRLGAYQNRLEHTINNLAVSNENMTASYSRIMDVDMAEEMTNYTTEQVISQAAISMLAQANERPSQVLQLLQ